MPPRLRTSVVPVRDHDLFLKSGVACSPEGSACTDGHRPTDRTQLHRESPAGVPSNMNVPAKRHNSTPFLTRATCNDSSSPKHPQLLSTPATTPYAKKAQNMMSKLPAAIRDHGDATPARRHSPRPHSSAAIARTTIVACSASPSPITSSVAWAGKAHFHVAAQRKRAPSAISTIMTGRRRSPSLNLRECSSKIELCTYASQLANSPNIPWSRGGVNRYPTVFNSFFAG